MTTAVLKQWEPENTSFWANQGAKVANRNLWISIPCLTLAFSVWVLWSIVTLNLNNAGFSFSKDQLFLLTALPALSGATLRIFYSFMPSIVGGRKWTTFSTATLLIPAIWLGIAVQDPSTPYPVMLTIALLCGFGGGNFSSSMANISFFFPKARKGYANGMNAGIGNLGVSLMQFVVPMIITGGMFGALGGEAQHFTKDGVEKAMWLQNAGFIWVPFIAVATIAAWFGMNDIADAKASFSDQAVIFKRKHNWLMCWLYLGTFGSFIGFAAGFALLTKTLFPGIPVAQYAFIGPLLGALIRPIGGILSDKLGGGAKITFWVFALMALATAGVIHFLPAHDATGALSGGSFAGFFAMFLALFVLTGIGNGSTFAMIPQIFVSQRLKETTDTSAAAQQQARMEGGKEAAAVLGFSGAIGAYGGFFIPKSFGTSVALTGGPAGALYVFIVFYISCLAITWYFYSRKNAPMPC